MELDRQSERKSTSLNRGVGIPIGGSIEEVYANINLGNDAVSGGGQIVENIQQMMKQRLQRGKQRKTAAKRAIYLPGRTVFVDEPTVCSTEQIQKLAQLLEEDRVQQAVIKIARGTSKEAPRLLKNISSRLRASQHQVWGWQQLTSDSGVSQAFVAVERIGALHLDGYIAQVGNEFNVENPEKEILALVDYLRKHAPNTPIGVMSYHYPSYHRDVPWEAILKSVDFIAPQVFWRKAHNPGAQLLRSLLEFQNLRPTRPIIPIGAAYQSDDWEPTESDLIEFIRVAESLNLPGAGFYHWGWLSLPQNEDLLDVILEGKWGEHTLEPEYLQRITAQATDQIETAEAMKEITRPEVSIPQFEQRFIQVIRNDDVRGAKDHLGFDAYASAFVDMILDERTRPPLTIGISGAWGSGKSFLLESVQRKLEKRVSQEAAQKRKARPGKRVHVVRFNAWDYNAYDAVWPGLVRQLIETLEKSLHPGALIWMRLKRNLRREYRAVRNKLIPWGLVALVGLIMIILAAGADWQQVVASVGTLSLVGLITNLVKMANEPLAAWTTRLFTAERGYGAVLDYMAEIRDDIDRLRKNLPEGDKVVVIIDDLDRCTAEKIASTLEAVKLLLTYDIFFVFLALDTSVVARAIEQHYKETLAEAGRSGYMYLDKIVQIPFRIPEPNAARVEAYISSLIKGIDDIPAETLPPTEARRLLPSLQLTPGNLARECETFLAALPNDAIEILRIANEVALNIDSPPDLFWIAAIWGLLARWWPVSTYLMHEELLRLPPGSENESALPLLYEAMHQHAETALLSRRLREQVDAAFDMLDKAIQAAPKIRIADLQKVLSHWDVPYTLTLGFTPKEIEAFYLLSKYLYKNPRHIKRLVNTYSLVRMLISHSTHIEDALVLQAPETILKWLIVASQWPFTAQVMLYEFENEIQADPNQPLSEQDDALARLYEKAMLRISSSPDLRKERDRLDYDPDTLEGLVRDGMTTIPSRRLNLLRTLTINFNPAEGSQSLVMVRALKPAVAA